MLRQVEWKDRPSLEIHSRWNQDNFKPEGNSLTAAAPSRRDRNIQAILSVAEAVHDECAVDADALGFMAKMLVQTTLPHRAQPGKQYTRTDGDVTLSITDLGGAGLPYGAYPRLILIWMTTEALRTGVRKLELGRSLSSFKGQLGLECTGGHWGTIPRFRRQMERLFGAAISTRWKRTKAGKATLEVSASCWRRSSICGGHRKNCPRRPLRSRASPSPKFFEQLIEARVRSI